MSATRFKSLEAAQAALTNRSVNTRLNAVASLQRLDGPMAILTLVNAMEDPEARVRARVALALGVLERKETVSKLTEHLRSDGSGDVRAMCAAALTLIKPQDIAQLLIPALQDPDERVVLTAAVTLGRLADRMAIPALRDLLNRSSWQIRLYACDALITANAVDTKVVDVLQELTQHPEASEWNTFAESTKHRAPIEAGEEKTLVEMLEKARRML